MSDPTDDFLAADSQLFRFTPDGHHSLTDEQHCELMFGLAFDLSADRPVRLADARRRCVRAGGMTVDELLTGVLSERLPDRLARPSPPGGRP